MNLRILFVDDVYKWVAVQKSLRDHSDASVCRTLKHADVADRLHAKSSAASLSDLRADLYVIDLLNKRPQPTYTGLSAVNDLKKLFPGALYMAVTQLLKSGGMVERSDVENLVTRARKVFNKVYPKTYPLPNEAAPPPAGAPWTWDNTDADAPPGLTDVDDWMLHRVPTPLKHLSPLKGFAAAVPRGDGLGDHDVVHVIPSMLPKDGLGSIDTEKVSGDSVTVENLYLVPFGHRRRNVHCNTGSLFLFSRNGGAMWLRPAAARFLAAAIQALDVTCIGDGSTSPVRGISRKDRERAWNAFIVRAAGKSVVVRGQGTTNNEFGNPSPDDHVLGNIHLLHTWKSHEPSAASVSASGSGEKNTPVTISFAEHFPDLMIHLPPAGTVNELWTKESDEVTKNPKKYINPATALGHTLYDTKRALNSATEAASGGEESLSNESAPR
jgi:hypothetical protein